MVTPILYRTLGSETYGIWATILPIFTWLSFFDLGIGNGLRNVITECVASNEYSKARKYIANAFIVCTIVSFAVTSLLVIIFSVLYFFPNLVDLNFGEDVQYAILLVVIAAIISFVLGLVNNLYHSLQQSHYVTYGQLINSCCIFLMLIPVYFDFFHNDILFTAAVYSVSLILSLFILTYRFFREHRSLLPSLLDINLNPKYMLLKVGLAFLILQLSSLIIFSSDKLIITTFVGPVETSSYDIAYKYFSVVIFMQSILTTPTWGAIADAIAKKDSTWISKAVKIQLFGFSVILMVLLGMLVFSETAFKVWIGSDFDITRSILLWMVIFIVVMSWNNIFSALLSGAGILKFQVYLALLAVLINVPLSISLLLYYKLSAESVLISSSISLSFFALISPFVFKNKIREVKVSAIDHCNSNIQSS
ncbi:hypothetical protein L6232_07105 [Shewanella sp. C31]|nr:hypothetical protein [Shewanella electrica]